MPAADEYEKLGLFYLGREWDRAAGGPSAVPLLYESKHLTTHAVIVGMTGSGKTGLGAVLLEEAAIDGIPAIAIDPKGDLGNLLLTFPELAAEQFAPWVSEGEDPAAVATRWREGLAGSGQDGARIGRFAGAVDRAIYTPGASAAGRGLSVLRSLAAPLAGTDADTVRERAVAATSGLLTLLGREADPMRSPEHTLVSNVLLAAWGRGRDLPLELLLREIVTPPLERIGVMDVEAVVPSRDRQALAMAINNLLASPGFAGFLEGEPLDVARLLRTPDGRPRLSIVSTAHLGEAERMFVVTLILGEVITWMRAQPGTGSLRAILYLDEVAGLVPPVAVPPSKGPLLTLLKQARAYGLGVVLATQNPVDLDYKGLSNAGTWFLGRLQTERDKLRVLDGLDGAAQATGRGFDRADADALLSGLEKRCFLVHDVHEEAGRLMQARWALSYLRGPMTRSEIARVTNTATVAAAATTTATVAATATAPATATAAATATAPRPLVPPEIPETFLPALTSSPVHYEPALLARLSIHYHQPKLGIDTFVTPTLVVPLGVDGPQWTTAWVLTLGEAPLVAAPAEGAEFAPVPTSALRPKSWSAWSKTLVQHVIKDRPLQILGAPALEAYAHPGESEGDFRARCADLCRQARDAEFEKLRQRLGPKIAKAQQQLTAAEQRLARERSQRNESVVVGGFDTVLAVFGRGSALSGARRVARSAGRASTQAADVRRAEQQIAQRREQLTTLDAELRHVASEVHAKWDPARLEIGTQSIRAKKGGVTVERTALLWLPWRAAPGAPPTPAWQ